MKEKIACFIPAKGKSSRLPGKNTLDLLGKPMLEYVIEAAKSSNLFDEEIYISTESIEIQSIAKKLGVQSPQLRPENLSNDPFGVKEVLLDFLNRNSFTQNWKTIVVLLPTSPLLLPSDIQSALNVFFAEKNKSLLSVTETDHNAYRTLEIVDGCIAPIFSNKIKKREQELPLTYRINGAIIIIDKPHFMKHKSFFTTGTKAFVMPKERSIDVDTPFDFKKAEFLLLQRNKNENWNY